MRRQHRAADCAEHLDGLRRPRRHDDALAGVVAEQATAVREFLRTVISDLVELGLRDNDTDIDAETTRWNAVVDGLSFELLTAPHLLTRDQARALLHATLLPS